jgi:hypothetical protein
MVKTHDYARVSTLANVGKYTSPGKRHEAAKHGFFAVAGRKDLLTSVDASL